MRVARAARGWSPTSISPTLATPPPHTRPAFSTLPPYIASRTEMYRLLDTDYWIQITGYRLMVNCR